MSIKRKKVGTRAVGLARKRQGSPFHKRSKLVRANPDDGLIAETRRAVKAYMSKTKES